MPGHGQNSLVAVATMIMNCTSSFQNWLFLLTTMASYPASLPFRIVLMPFCFPYLVFWATSNKFLKIHPINFSPPLFFLTWDPESSSITCCQEPYLIQQNKYFLGRMSLCIQNLLYPVKLFLFFKEGQPKYRKRELTGIINFYWWFLVGPYLLFTT